MNDKIEFSPKKETKKNDYTMKGKTEFKTKSATEIEKSSFS